MKFYALLIAASLLMLSAPVAAQRLAIITPLVENVSVQQQEEVDRWLRQQVEQHYTLQTQPPAISLSRLVRSPTLLSQRQQAATLLSEASALVEQVSYKKARRLLRRAGSAAEQGLAQLVDPRLLAEIRLQWGIAELPLDAERARQSLIESYQLWPNQQSAAKRGLSPKIARELDSARAQAASRPIPGITPQQAQKVAQLLEVDQLLVILIRTHGDHPAARMLWFDVAGDTSRETQLSWTASSATEAQTTLWPGVKELLPASALRAVSDKSGGKEQPASQRTAKRSWGPWIVGGAGAVSLVSGAVLLVLAHRQAAEAEDKAGTDVDYYPTIYDQEQSARNLQTGAIVAFAVGGSAVAAALIWALWPRDESPDDAALRLSPGPGGLSFSF